jgi:hypothetical protein
MNVEVGGHVDVPPGVAITAQPTLLDRAKRALPMFSTEENGLTAWHSRPLVQPGMYTLKTGTRSIPIAVNLPGESPDPAVASAVDVRTLPDAGVQKKLGGIEISFEGDGVPTMAQNRDTGRDFGWGFLLALLILCGVECFLAMHFGHYRKGSATAKSASAASGGATGANGATTAGGAAAPSVSQMASV